MAMAGENSGSHSSKSDHRGEFFRDHVVFFERNVLMLQAEITKWMQSNIEHEKRMIHFRDSITTIAVQEPFEPLRDSMYGVSQSIQMVVDSTHDVMCDRPEKILLASLAQIQTLAISPIKKLLKDRDTAMKLETKLQKECEAMTSKSKAREKKLRMLSDQKRRVENVNNLVEFHIKKLEHFRVTRLKKILQEMEWSQMHYHCKSLEAIPTASKLASKIDPKEAVKNIGTFIDQL